MLEKVEHVGIYVKDLDRSIGFYTGVLGLPLVQRMTVDDGGLEIAFIGIGDTQLELLCPREHGVNKGEGVIAHLAFTVRDIDEVVSKIKGKIQPIDEEPRPALDGCRVFFFKGPDGETLELFQPKQ